MKPAKRISSPYGEISYQRDEWGYPRINAPDRNAGAWALGWFHAVDRRLQTELTRYAGEGRLMELLGPEPFARSVDRGSRTLGLAKGLEAEVDRLSGSARARCEAYCAGFEEGARTAGLPLAARLLGLERRSWTPRDVLLSCRVVAWFGLVSATQAGRIAVARLLAEDIDEDALRLLLGPGAERLDMEACRKMEFGTEDGLGGLPAQYGSNAFAVSAERSASGRPLLMTEFHLEIGRFPPVAHVAHVQHGDGTYLQGISFPGLPVVSAGRTDAVAWGYTFGHTDNIDVTVERCRNGKRQAGETWVELSQREERVRVRGKPDETWTFWDFDSGTLLGDPRGPKADSVRLLPGVAWRGQHTTAVSLNTNYGSLVEQTGRLYTKICSTQGRYVWRSNRLRRQRASSPKAISTSASGRP